MRYIRSDNKILRFGWVIVDSDKRGRGYGKRILKLSLKYAFEIFMAEKVTIGVYEDNLPAYHCYKSVGFHETAAPESEYDEINGQKKRIVEFEITQNEYYKAAFLIS
jgi:RimJ/RimL family protein N-acetyltransferase